MSQVRGGRQEGKYLGQIVEVKPSHGFDLRRLEIHLRRAIPGFSGPLTARQFESGQSNLTYLLETPGAAYVLRRKPPGKLLKSAHAVDREFRVMRALAPTAVFIP